MFEVFSYVFFYIPILFSVLQYDTILLILLFKLF